MKRVMLVLLIVFAVSVSASATLVITNGDLASPFTPQTTTSGDGNGNGAEPVMFDQFVAVSTGARGFGWSVTDPKYQAIVHVQSSTPARNRAFYYAFKDNSETTGEVTLNFTFVNETDFSVDVGVGFFGWNEGDDVLMDLGGNVSVAECIPNTISYQIGMTVLGNVDYLTSATPEVIEYSHKFDLGITAYNNIAFVVFVRSTQDTTFTIAADGGTGSTFFFDDFSLGEGKRESARMPRPADGQEDVPRDGVVLEWSAGEFAASHDVYFGTSIEDANAATHGSPGFMGNQTETVFALDYRLEFGQTYYWHIDEVAVDGTVSKGSVWSFTVEQFGYPIENIIATASSVNRADERLENTINGSGLDDDDLHSSENADMWLSSITGPQPTWIQYEFDRIYKLHQMWVWNYNSSVEPVIGFSVKEATIEYSADGTNWITLGTTHEFAQGPGAAGYAHNTIVDLEGVSARYVRITANSNWGGIVNQYGLSEVRFLYIPIWAREPSPDSGATNVSVDAILSFRAGREAARHDVYLSIDEQAVIDGNAPVTTVTETSYGPLALDLDTAYYWRVDEVNDAETPANWQGDIWSFLTQEYLVVEDFEPYNDIPAGQEGSNLVYGTWADGFDNPANGSTIGYNEPFQPTIETSIFYDGKQSVPLFYDNTAATYSEVTASVADLQAGQDWTRHGIKALTLRFYGDPNNNVQQMYVKINDSMVTYDGDTEDLKRIGWQMWYIDLASLGVSLSNVTELAIGFERIGAVGGQGKVLLDGIRLYSHDRQLITPAAPGAVGLQAHYEFEGNTNDSSGNARNGTIMGSPTFVAGKVGQAINLRGLNDYVEITGY